MSISICPNFEVNKNLHFKSHVHLIYEWMFVYAMVTLLRWFENINKLKTLLTEPRKIKRKKIKISTNANGHFWPKHHDAHSEHQCQIFSKLSPMIFLHGLQDHIKVITLEFAILAETFSNAYNKNAKWQSNIRFKITHFW